MKEMQSDRQTDKYFGVYVYANHFILGVIRRANFWRFGQIFWRLIRPLTEAVLVSTFLLTCRPFFQRSVILDETRSFTFLAPLGA